MVRYLAGDVGGTNTRLQLLEAPDQQWEEEDTEDLSQEVLISEHTYISHEYSSLTVIIQKFLEEFQPGSSSYPVACCLAVAGPVRSNTANLTNLGWKLDGDEMEEILRMKVHIINDFVGSGYGLLALKRGDLLALNDVKPTPGAPKCVIGAGTGLGEGYLTYNGSEYEVFASEGGHVDFSCTNDVEYELMKWMRERDNVDRVSVERICSGTAIPKVYEFFTRYHPNEVNNEVQAKLRQAKKEEMGAIISEYARTGQCTLCIKTIELFVKVYGSESGNFALKVLPFGGMYIAGGIAAKILWAIQKDHQFWNAFVNKGRMTKLLNTVPLYLVKNPQVGLMGAKVVCRRMLRKSGYSPKLGPVPETPARFDDPNQPFFWGENMLPESYSELKDKPVALTRKETFRESINHKKQLQEVQSMAIKMGLLSGAIASVVTVGAVALMSFMKARAPN